MEKLSAAKRFRAWLETEGLTLERAGHLIGCSTGQVWKLREGTRSPGLALAIRIADATARWHRGPIRPDEWVAPAELERRAS